MPLTYLLYQCPRCGNRPLEGVKDRAACPSCGTEFSRGNPGGLIRVREPSGATWQVPAYRLVAALEGGEGDSAPGTTVGLPVSAEVRMRRSGRERAVHWHGRLLGFAEAMGEGASGVLTLSEEGLEIAFHYGQAPDPATGEGVASMPAGGTGAGEQDSRLSWSLLEIRAVQTSSSSLQFSPRGGGLVELRFPYDSPLRWETLLRGALRRAYRREGRGEIVEFQPRIVTG